MQAHGAEIAYLFNLLAEIGGRRMFCHAKRRPASEPRGDGYEQRGRFSAILAVPVRPREAHYSRTAERPPSVVPAIAYRRTSRRSVRLAKAALGALALTTTYLIKHNLYVKRCRTRPSCMGARL